MNTDPKTWTPGDGNPIADINTIIRESFAGGEMTLFMSASTAEKLSPGVVAAIRAAEERAAAWRTFRRAMRRHVKRAKLIAPGAVELLAGMKTNGSSPANATLLRDLARDTRGPLKRVNRVAFLYERAADAIEKLDVALRGAEEIEAERRAFVAEVLADKGRPAVRLETSFAEAPPDVDLRTVLLGPRERGTV